MVTGDCRLMPGSAGAWDSSWLEPLCHLYADFLMGERREQGPWSALLLSLLEVLSDQNANAINKDVTASFQALCLVPQAASGHYQGTSNRSGRGGWDSSLCRGGVAPTGPGPSSHLTAHSLLIHPLPQVLASDKDDGWPLHGRLLPGGHPTHRETRAPGLGCQGDAGPL